MTQIICVGNMEKILIFEFLNKFSVSIILLIKIRLPSLVSSDYLFTLFMKFSSLYC